MSRNGHDPKRLANYSATLEGFAHEQALHDYVV